MTIRSLGICSALAFGTAFALLGVAETDPGPRKTTEATWGQPLPGLSSADLAAFSEGFAKFREVVSVSGTEPGAPGVGLGPRFNLNSCAGCHAQPTVGGTSPRENPQVALAKAYGAENSIPSFIKADGPVRVVRFSRGGSAGPGGGRGNQPPPPPGRGGRGPGGPLAGLLSTAPPGAPAVGGRPDGGVHDLFVIAGRKDANGCEIRQPDFAGAVAQRNAFFRIPTPLYGAGLIEAISEASIMNNLRADQPLKQSLGIGGRENRNQNDGTITRFGWKAQDKSLVTFAAEAMNVEEGVTNDLFPHEREDTPGCAINATPEDRGGAAIMAEFMRYLAPPVPAQATAATERGKQTFASIGCATCHTPNLRTGKSNVVAMNEKWVPLYSDLALHDMGPGLDDFISQGEANGRDWRTAPLWGLGQRLFFLHDGRTSDLAQAIREHGTAGSEAYRTTAKFEALSSEQKQDLLSFLRSL
jgi:CxxC motif-containing protein (DUF1111 family)